MRHRPLVLDACAVLAILKNERGADAIREHLQAALGQTYMHVINVFEAAYHLAGQGMRTEWAWKAAHPQGVKLIDDCGPSSLAFRALRIKTQYRHLSWATALPYPWPKPLMPVF
ncbi:MAG: hypothetical protein LBE84_12525 [Planctomycetota bacterium]|nr:hypothetical protein [Planctomycetota bacterium]